MTSARPEPLWEEEEEEEKEEEEGEDEEEEEQLRRFRPGIATSFLIYFSSSLLLAVLGCPCPVQSIGISAVYVHNVVVS